MTVVIRMGKASHVRLLHSAGQRGGDSGAHAVELSLTILVIALIFLGMADFMRFLAVKMLATKGAQEGLALAERLSGIDTDLREKCRTIPVEDDCKSDYYC